MPNMEINVKSTVGQAIAGMNQVQRELAETAQQYAKLDSTMERGSRAVQKSTKDFTGLSRVIQDLPFGFIGIQNNITQLLPAAGALGLVLSTVTAAVTFAQTGFSNWTRGMSGAKKEAEEAKTPMEQLAESQKQFREQLDSSRASALSSAISLKGYVDIAKDSRLPLEQRNQALMQANDILGEHAQKLTLSTINTQAATEAINKFTEALVQQALADQYANRIADLIIQQRNALRDYNKELEATNAAREKYRSYKISDEKSLVDLYKDFAEQDKKRVEQGRLYNEITREINTLFGDLKTSQMTATENMQEMEQSAGKTKKTIADLVKEINKAYDIIGQREQLTGLNLNADRIKENQKAIEEAFKIGATFDNPFVQLLQEGTNELKSQLPLTAIELRKGFDDAFAKPPAVSIPVTPLIGIGDDADKEFTERNKKRLANLKQEIADTANALNGLLAPAFDNVFNAISKGENVFQALGESLKAMVIDLAKAALQAAAVAAIVSLLNPGAKFGDIFLKILGGGLPKFAQGGIVPPGYPNDSYPALLSSNEAVIPLDRLGSMLQGGGGSFPAYLPAFELRGDVLRAWYQRAENSYRRRN